MSDLQVRLWHFGHGAKPFIGIGFLVQRLIRRGLGGIVWQIFLLGTVSQTIEGLDGAVLLTMVAAAARSGNRSAEWSLAAGSFGGYGIRCRARGVGAFDKDVVVRITGYMQRMNRRHHLRTISDQIGEMALQASADLQFGARKHSWYSTRTVKTLLARALNEEREQRPRPKDSN